MAVKHDELLKEILTSFDTPEDVIKGIIDGDKEVKEFIDFKNENFMAKKLAFSDPEISAAIAGKITKNINKKLESTFGLTKDEIEGKKVEELLDIVKGVHDTALADIKTEGGKDNDEKVKGLEVKLTESIAANKGLEDKFMDANKKTETLETEFAGKVKQFKIDSLLSTAKSQLTFKEDISPLEKQGFDMVVNNKFKFDLSEDGSELIPLDEKGEKVLNEKKTEHAKTIEVLTQIATENKLLNMTPPGSGGGGNPPKEKIVEQIDNNSIKTTKLAEHTIASILGANVSIRSRQKLVRASS